MCGIVVNGVQRGRDCRVKYANATVIHVDLGVNDTTLRPSIDDDGDGGADRAPGSGIIGLIDRVDAMGGKLTLRSPLGEGTSLVIELPLEPAGELTAAARASSPVLLAGDIHQGGS